MSNFYSYYAPDPSGNIFLPWGAAGVGVVDPRDVADVAAHVLTSGDHRGKAYTLTGPETITGARIATILTETTGRGMRYVDVPEDTMRQGMLAHGMPTPMIDGILDLHAASKAGRMATVTTTVADLLGRAARSFQEFARDHAPSWSA